MNIAIASTGALEACFHLDFATAVRDAEVVSAQLDRFGSAIPPRGQAQGRLVEMWAAAANGRADLVGLAASALDDLADRYREADAGLYGQALMVLVRARLVEHAAQRAELLLARPMTEGSRSQDAIVLAQALAAVHLGQIERAASILTTVTREGMAPTIGGGPC